VKLDPSMLGTLLGGLGADQAMAQGLAELLGSVLAGEDAEDEAEEARRRRRAARRLRRLQQAMHRLAEREALLTEALGACACWAEDPACPQCRGRGGPGHYEPSPAAFAAVVAPLLRSRRELVQSYLDETGPSTRSAS
jgi:hypothetical protein